MPIFKPAFEAMRLQPTALVAPFSSDYALPRNWPKLQEDMMLGLLLQHLRLTLIQILYPSHSHHSCPSQGSLWAEVLSLEIFGGSQKLMCS